MRSYINKILLLTIVLALAGCGENDPLVTDTITVSASVTSLGAGQSSVITATVKQADGKAVTGRSVSFSFVANNSAGTLTVTDNGTNNGVATAIYTAGTSEPVNSIQDTVQASISNGASAAVVITRTGSATPLANFILTLTAAPITLSAGQNSIVTANVTDSIGTPLSGVTVTFSLPTKNSGVPALSATTVATDGSGNAITIYSPGTASPTISLDDIVQASLANGSTRLVTITRSGTAAPLPSAIKTLTASPVTLHAGQNSIVTANVTDSAGAPLSGVTVTFSLPTKNSGAPTLSATTVVTDGSGNAITIYAPGTASPTVSLDDIVQASLATGSTRLVTITRSGTAAALPSAIKTLTASPVTLSAGQNSIITANVTDSAGTPVSGVIVAFSIPGNNSGVPTLSSATVVTDGSGNAITIYSPGTASPTASVDDIVQASLANGSTRLVTITRSGTAATADNVTLTSSCGGTVVASNSCVVTATVTDASGSTVSLIAVTFKLEVSGTGAAALRTLNGNTVGPYVVTTDGSGQANIIYTAGAIASQTDVITAAIGGVVSKAIVITD